MAFFRRLLQLAPAVLRPLHFRRLGLAATGLATVTGGVLWLQQSDHGRRWLPVAAHCEPTPPLLRDAIPAAKTVTEPATAIAFADRVNAQGGIMTLVGVGCR